MFSFKELLLFYAIVVSMLFCYSGLEGDSSQSEQIEKVEVIQESEKLEGPPHVVEHLALEETIPKPVEPKIKSEPEFESKSQSVSEPVIATVVSDAVDNPIISCEGSVSADVLACANENFNKVPKQITDMLYNEGWEIVITSKDIATVYYQDTSLGHISGLTVVDSRTIYLSNTEWCVNRALVHEVGHVYDSSLGFVSQNAVFDALYKEEKWVFNDIENCGDDHNTSSSLEYFAETFHHYVLYPANLKKTAPKTYAYFEGLVG